MSTQQTAILGRWQSYVQEGLHRLKGQNSIQRLWNRDSSLWSSDPFVQQTIRNRLGWLEIPKVMAGQVPSLSQFVQAIRQEGFSQALLLGMGGSGLFTEVCHDTLATADAYLDLTVLDTTDPAAILSVQRRWDLKRLLVIVSSKSGTTLEVEALFAYFSELLEKAGRDPSDCCIAITDAGTALENQARRRQYRQIFVHGPQTGQDVGGRFSAFTYFGLVPAALMGLDIAQLLDRALEMFKHCRLSSLQDNPAAVLGAAMAQWFGAGKDKMTLICPPALESFGTWVEQLLAESTGKCGKGIIPIVGEVLRSPSRYLPDRFFIELQLRSQPDEAMEHHVMALADAGHPVLRIQWEDLYDLGGEAAKWCVATAVAGHLLGINPFDEPNVTQSKEQTKMLLTRYRQEGRFPLEKPWLAEDDLAVYGSVKSTCSFSEEESGKPFSQPISRCLALWCQQIRPVDFVAVLSFLPRTPTLDESLRKIRQKIADVWTKATMLQFGPRYLHSTGQLYKGGTDNGVFLLLTAEDSQGLTIPGMSLNFSVLKQAQALGDFQAMAQQGRRILRVHLGGQPERSMAVLMRAFEEVLESVSVAS